MVELQIIDCKECKTQYLVGIDGKDIRDANTSGDKFHFSIGDDEIEKSLNLITEKVPCKNCGTMCKIITIGGTAS